MKTKLTPEFNEGMPREVAISILSEPKAKLTNAFRKTCKRALEKHYVAPLPQPVPPGTDLLQKWHGATLEQLLKWSKRCSARRRVVQREYETLIALENPTRQQKTRVTVLTLQVNALDNMRDNIDDERGIRVKIATRIASAEADSPRAVREQIRLDTQRGN